jgi:ADP-ribosylglycohydrolase
VEPDEVEAIFADAPSPPSLEPLARKAYAARIAGAWHGRCAGVVLGKPLERGWDRQQVQAYLESCGAYPLDDWVPPRSEALGITLRSQASTRGNVRFVEPDDDVHYTILSLLLAEQEGLDFTPTDIVESWLRNVPYNWLWSATKQAYYHAVNMTDDRPKAEQIAEFPTRLNPWREGINGTIRVDFWGYIAPGDPRRAARLAHRETSVNMVKNGIYGAMFAAACISAALSKHPNVEAILASGFSAIPKRSRLAEALHRVIDWYGQDRDWVRVCDRIYQHYGHLYTIAAINNLAVIVLALLHGELDYTRSITTAVMCGLDTDCTGGTVGSIVGAALGDKGIEPRWIEPFHDTIKTAVAGFGHGTLSDLIQRTVACHERVRPRSRRGKRG